jgi:hypothetical protein
MPVLAQAAQDAATAAAGSAAASATSAANSSTSSTAAAGSQLAATTAANLASGYAAAAGSVAQQDLGGVTAAALHRSPNAITAAILYDTSKDGDGGEWVERCGHTSWANEALNGNWLTTTDVRGFQSELHARCAGATLGTELLVNGTFDTGITGWDTSLTTPPGTVTWDSVGKRATLTRVTGNIARMDQSMTTVAGVLYKFTVTVDNNCSVLCGTAQGTTQYLNVSGIGWGTLEFFFTATTTTTWIRILTTVDGVLNVDNVSIKPVTLATKSGNYYQLATDGKCYRLSAKNLLLNNSMTGGVSGTYGAGAVAPTSWSSPFATGQITFSPSARDVGAQQVRFVGIATDRPYFSQLTNAIAGATYTLSCYVEAITSGTLRIDAVLLASPVPTGAVVSFRKNGGAATTATAIAAGDFLEIIIAMSTTAGTIQTRWGLGASTGTAGDVTLSVPQIEMSFGGAVATTPCEVTTPTNYGETFRGNTAKFPRLFAVIGEASRIVIYDLTNPGRPMWMVFQRGGTTASISNMLGSTSVTVSGMAFVNGVLAVADNSAAASAYSLFAINFIGDFTACNRPASGAQLRYSGSIAQRNDGKGWLVTSFANLIGNGTVNAVAITVQPEAPLDPVTGLQIPTIAVATAGGASIIKYDGTVSSNAFTGLASFDTVAFSSGWLMYGNGNNFFAFRYIRIVDITGSTFAGTSFVNPNVANGARSSGLSGGIRGVVASMGAPFAAPGNTGQNSVNLIRTNVGTPASSLRADITPYYNTGWIGGSILRAWMAEPSAGTLSSATLVTDGTFDNATNLAQWVTQDGNVSRAYASGGLQVTTNVSAASDSVYVPVVTVPGTRYVVTAFNTPGTNATGGYMHARDGTTNGPSVHDTTGNISVPTAAAGTVTITFAAASALTYIRLGTAKTANDSSILWDNVVCKTQGADRSFKIKSLSVNNTLTKTAVGVASQLVAISGFSNDTSSWLSTEMVTNGDFTVATGWTTTAGLTIASGVATWSNIGGADLSTSINVVSGRAYTITYTITSATGSPGGVGIHNSAGVFIRGAITRRTTAGTYTETLIATATGPGNLIFNGIAVGAASISLDNVSVKAADAFGSTANVLQEEASTDLDVGTAAFNATGWMNVPSGKYAPHNLFALSTFPGSGASGTLATGWGVTGATVASLSVAQEVVNGKATGVVKLRRTNATGLEGEQQNFALTANQLYSGSILVRVPTGLTAPGLVFYDGVVQPVIASAATLNAQAKDVWVSYPFSYTPASAGLVASFAALNSNPGDGFDIAMPQLNRGVSTTYYESATATPFNGIAPIFDRSGPNGAYYRFGIDGSGFLAGELFDGTTTRRATTPVLVNDGTWYSARLTYDGAGKVAVLLAGREVANTTGAALLTLNNANALATVGNNYSLNAAFPGSIALVKVSASVPTAEQALWMYEQEKMMFRDGAQVTLPDANNIAAIAYDDKLDTFRCVSSGFVSSFTGLIRTSAAAISAGTYTQIAARAGATLVARTSTNPGADITLPAQNLKEELQRRAIAAAKVARQLRVFDFDAITSQTDFVLPVGWEATEVISGGASKREGSTKDWTRVFDGFRETIRFAVAPGNAVWVQITARMIEQ